MRRLTPLVLASGIAGLLGFTALRPVADAAGPAPAAARPLKALLVIGGCCHDYGKQKDLLKAGLEARANIVVDIAYSPDSSTKPKFEAYLKDNWYAGYDVIIHDECAADVKEADYVQNILAAHKAGIPGVNLHCAMHCYRDGDFQKPVAPGAANASWFEYIGLQSTGHGPQLPIDINFVDKAHPSTATLSNWTTIKEELYNNIALLTSHPLAKGKQTVNGREVETVVAWTNEYGAKKTRVWSTTLGHNNETVADARYLDMVTRGLLWSVDKLNPDYLKAQK